MADEHRLTRQELSWLLTQEARGAAEKLRRGVALLKAPEAAPGEHTPVPVESTLDALDESMRMLATLHTGAGQRGRRGRIDLAALLCEIAPDARVAIEPGSGTEVFGDEAEIRRMLHVLIGSPGSAPGTEGASPDVSVRREGNDVCIEVALGPDSSPRADVERTWLSRMAIRYGGRLELEQGAECLSLPAEGATDRSEVEALRRELDEARRQGEAYARELAAVFTQSEAIEAGPHRSSYPPPAPGAFAEIAVVARALAAQFRSVLGAISRELGSARARGGEAAAVADALSERLALGTEVAAELGRLSACPLDEVRERIDLAEAAREAAAGAGAHAARRGVRIEVDAPSAVSVDQRPGALAVLLRAALDHAVAATPPGGMVRVGVAASGAGAVLTIDDGGPAVAAGSRRTLLTLEGDASAHGRPLGVCLHAAHALGAQIGARVELGDTPGPAGAGARVTIRL